MTSQEQAYQLAVRVTENEFQRVKKLVEAGLYRNSADFLREALRDKFRELEPVSVRNIPIEKAKKMIEEFLEKHPGLNFTSDIAEALGLEYRTAFEAVGQLLGEGQIRKTEV